MLPAVIAQTASGEAPGFDIFGLLLPLALAFLLFTMFRRQRKAQQEVKEMRTQMHPGTEVMTQFGLFGTIVSIDQDNNKAVLELSPGNHATVHMQALSKVVLQDPAAVGEDPEDLAGGSTAPAGSPTGQGDGLPVDDADRTAAGGSSAAGAPTGAAGPFGTHPEEGARSIPADRDALDRQDPGTKRDN